MELEYIKNYIHVDYNEDDDLIKLFIDVGKKYITDGFSVYNENNLAHRLILLKAVKSLYDNRDSDTNNIYLSIKLQEYLGDLNE
ncbi:phage gp6-like head-tail connector protein [Clostridium botulinum]|uniref:Phage gp6-like head-tail connector protein n=1 Tax=Clostridium botulinum TaxID=1491 RepID=A0A6M0SLF0_CLOBO|nr:head-tail connector protein [Clostridium botulinum]NFA42132.1 phage gp6-like head-tail connector protein [Clostridium botulinum]